MLHGSYFGRGGGFFVERSEEGRGSEGSPLPCVMRSPRLSLGQGGGEKKTKKTEGRQKARAATLRAGYQRRRGTQRTTTSICR